MSFAKTDSRIKCFYCRRTGNIARNCYKKKNDENRNRHKRHTGHFVGKGLNYDLKLFVSDATIFAETDEVETWFVDSGASTHMTCNKHWYENFKETNNGANIYLGDERAYQIKGYGDIIVILPNGIIRRNGIIRCI